VLWCLIDANTALLGCLCHGKQGAVFSSQAHGHEGSRAQEWDKVDGASAGGILAQ